MRRIPTLVWVVAFLLVGFFGVMGSYIVPGFGLGLTGSSGNALHVTILAAWVLSVCIGCVVIWKLRHLFFMLLFVVIAIGLIAFGFFALGQHQILESHGMQTTGEILKRGRQVTKYTYDFVLNAGKTTDYSIDYVYEAAGKAYDFHGMSVSKDTWDSAATNPKLPIRYLPEAPSISEIDLPAERTQAGMLPWGCLIGGAFVFLGALRIWDKRPRLSASSTTSGWKGRGPRR